MKRIKFDEIEVGDYIKAILNNEQYSRWDRNNRWKINRWKITYFKVIKNDGEDLEGNFWLDFDCGNIFLRTLKKGDNIGKRYCKFYKLTEKEFIKKLGKYIIIGSL